jgi:hypothetical protein
MIAFDRLYDLLNSGYEISNEHSLFPPSRGISKDRKFLSLDHPDVPLFGRRKSFKNKSIHLFPDGLLVISPDLPCENRIKPEDHSAFSEFVKTIPPLSWLDKNQGVSNILGLCVGFAFLFAVVSAYAWFYIGLFQLIEYLLEGTILENFAYFVWICVFASTFIGLILLLVRKKRKIKKRCP